MREKDSLEFRRNLRRTATEAEKLLWHHLRNRQIGGLKFRRQRPVEPYFCDFYCAERRVGIELDGGGHFTVEGEADDAKRTEHLTRHGVFVLRFTNAEVFTELEAVLQRILDFTLSVPAVRPGPTSR